MAAGKSQDAATENRSGCRSSRSWLPKPDFEKPISQFCSVPVMDRLALTQGTSCVVMNDSYWTLALAGLSAYHGLVGKAGWMMVRLYWFWASAASAVAMPSP